MWPYQEASRIRRSDNVVFSTGFGPSGNPHLGTLSEVTRTSWVRRAYEEQTGQASRLIVFSDDMDALRKVPENVPNKEMLGNYIGQSLSAIPDPYGTHSSFAEHNNAMLRDFLDRFGFDYEFVSSSQMYLSGAFDETLLLILRNLEAVCEIILPTLGEARRATYCPFMPIVNNRVYDSGYVSHDVAGGTVTFEIEGELTTIPVTGGNCKLQWKVDWAMRWIALGVSYEMSGKDLTDSVVLSSKIVRALGYQAPVGMTYELFLDANGRKISKSVGNGVSVDQWLTYGPPESLSYFLFREPRRAKNLRVSNIPRAIDDYWNSRRLYSSQTEQQRQGNPVHHIHGGNVPTGDMNVSFAMLLNLIGIMGEPTEEMVLGYIQNNYVSTPEVQGMVAYAIAYHRDCVETPDRRIPTEAEGVALHALAVRLAESNATEAEALQTIVYNVGKEQGYADRLREWFVVIYETVLGGSEGPRLGNFIEIYGVMEFSELLMELSCNRRNIENAG